MMIKYKKSLIILFCSLLTVFVQAQFRTQIFQQNIKTLQVGIQGEKFLIPVIELGGDNIIQIQFDEMSHESHAYTYQVVHCNADWTPSSINSNEYLSGFTTADITDFQLSVNTTFLYTHYNFTLPNNDMQLKLSGNYVVHVYEDNNPDKKVLDACFSIVEPKVAIQASVRGNTDTELNGKLQQLDFDVQLNGYQVKDASSEIKVLVRQNNRIDNEVRNLQPTFFSGSKLSFINNRSLIFEGGNEFHTFDISSVYAASRGVERVVYNQPHYDVLLTEDKILATKSYTPEQDVNGRFVINHQESFDNQNLEGDYMWVQFKLATKEPFFDGLLYLGGEFNYNQLNDAVMLRYDANAGQYYQSVLLKQGGYNYQYRFVPKGQKSAIVGRVDGSYWQTNNEYTIYIYHRPWGERYDKLIGVKQLQ